MRCTSPKTVGFLADGKTLCWSPKKYSKQFATFQIPCGKCISCRLEYARQWAIRCVHEAKMHPENCFITLTYAEENLKSDKLVYQDFQTFVKNLRSQRFQGLLDLMFPTLPQKEQRQLWRKLPKERQNELNDSIRISVFVTGEYGDRQKRPHWHALLFNYRPEDSTYKYSNDRGDKIYSSETLGNLWPHGISELGDVTFESAGYCARYAAKKLAHGPDQSHDFNPISKKSCKHAIGKSFLEKYWKEIFDNGFVIVNNTKSSIPRYYEKWLKRHQPEAYARYVTQLKNDNIQKAIAKEELTTLEEKKINMKRSALKGLQVSRNHARKRILEQKFKQLQERLKL